MRTAIISGSGGLVGSESVRHFAERGYDVVGLENDMRAQFFGPSASTAHTTQALEHDFPEAFRSLASTCAMSMRLRACSRTRWARSSS